MAPGKSTRAIFLHGRSKIQLGANANYKEGEFYHVITVLSPEVAAEVADVITTPDPTEPYTRLKEAIIERLSLSETQKLKQLLPGQKLGSRKPSHLLPHMKSLVESSISVNEHVLRELFLQQKPSDIKLILISLTTLGLKELVEVADKILETTSSAAVASTSTTTHQPPWYYSILFYETTDISHLSQLSLTLRYAHDGNIREDVVSFVEALAELLNAEHENEYESDEEDWKEAIKLLTAEEAFNETSTPRELSSTGKVIGQIVLSQLKKRLKLPLERCVGIGTDGCAVMLSEVRGAATEVQKEARNAVKTPCYSHKLNNSISRSSKVPAIRDAVAVMKEVIAFFKSHPKRP